MNDSCAPTAARSLALAEVRAAVRAHRLTLAEVFPPAEAIGLVDLDALKVAGLNSSEHSAGLLAAHQFQDAVQLACDMARTPAQKAQSK